MSSLARLQTRLFLAMLGAIMVAFAVGMIATWLTGADPSTRPVQVLAKNLANRLDVIWDDSPAADAYVARIAEDTGIPMQLRRDGSSLPKGVHRAVLRGSAIAYESSEGAFIPILHHGTLVGAIQLESSGYRPPHWSRPAAGFGAVLVVLGFMARRVARQLARPLEQVADTAERFGAGQLDARTDLGAAPSRWVADEVRDLAGAFDTMAERIAAIVRDQRELLAAVSHELRSPLGRARIALEIARERVTDPTAPPQLDQIERELGSVDAILGDLLAVTRAGLSDLRKETVLLGPWLRARLAVEGGAGSVELSHVEDASASVDQALLGRALHNLIDNARAHGHPPSEPLDVRLLKRGEVARIVVRDRGPGFTPEMLVRAFEPFVRGDPARSPIRGGSGLGLALVRRIAEAHGGSAFATNVVLDGHIRGAEVGIELPAP